MLQFAVTYAAGVFDTRTQLMGRQSAGVGFLRAALDANPDRVFCYAASRADAEIFGRDILRLARRRPELRYVAWDNSAGLASAGLLYRADPGISQDAWHRRRQSQARAYSLCGITHTISSHAAMSVLRDSVTAPLYPWDAMICTSTVARDVVRRIVESEMEHLTSKLGATSFTLPQFPMIPLGVHCEDFSPSPDRRAAARAAFGLGEDDVAALFVGRLSFSGKAHPLPMFLGLEEAQRRCSERISLILYGSFQNAAIQKAFLDEAQALAPSIRLIVADGKDNEQGGKAWAAADFFTSLSDNIQETFGLTPVEALAAGLPVVVSDWNGYKDTIRHGIDGYRVPTASPPPGSGGDLADQYAHTMLGYDHYIGRVSLLTSVDIDAAAAAYTTLIQSRELREKMGAAGRASALQTFDWSIVFRRYQSLWEELAERRRADPLVRDETSKALRADRLDPFSLFQTFPTTVLGARTQVSLRKNIADGDAERRLDLLSVNYARAMLPPPAQIQRIVDHLRSSGAPVEIGVLAASLGISMQTALRFMAWLAKMGIVSIEREGL